jgi:MFS family permease
VQKQVSKAQYGELAGLFGLQFMALGIWLVPLSAVLDAHGLNAIKPYAFATSATATFISPLIFGAMADRKTSPVKVLRWLSVASAVAMLLVGWSIHAAMPAWVVLACIQIYAFCAAPTPSIANAVVLSGLGNSRNEFGPIRAGGTIGWMAGCWLVSAFGADASVKAECIGAGMWLVVAAYTFLLPCIDPPASAQRMTWKQRFGWDALVLFKNRDHRVVFIATIFFSIPMASFYAFTPPHLQHLGFKRVAAWMTLGQIMEIASLLALGSLLVRCRLKWIFLIALGTSVPRFLACASDTKAGVLTGTLLHGMCYALFFITAQVYLDERVESSWRGRAQALLSLANNGVGNLAGYLGTGWWFAACKDVTGMRWPLFWGGLAAISACVAAYFLYAYHGLGAHGRAMQNKESIVAQETIN